MNFEEHARESIKNFARKDPAKRFALVDAAGDREIGRVLDLGCGPGHELLPFLERTGAFCVGIDIADALGKVTREAFGHEERARFVQCSGSSLPFADASFDVVLCRVALPYMNNRDAIAETARILKPGGVFLLKTHSPRFYFWMIRERIASLNPKMLAYPLICLAAGIWHSLTGRQPEGGFWRGKEVYQTEGFVEEQCARTGMRIVGRLDDDNPLTPSYRIVKTAAGTILFANLVGGALAIQ